MRGNRVSVLQGGGGFLRGRWQCVLQSHRKGAVGAY